MTISTNRYTGPDACNNCGGWGWIAAAEPGVDMPLEGWPRVTCSICNGTGHTDDLDHQMPPVYEAPVE